jgi:ABC-type uncharacterized transport system permease subunit
MTLVNHLLWVVMAAYMLSWFLYFLNFELQRDFYFASAKGILAGSLFLHLLLWMCMMSREVWPVAQRVEAGLPLVILFLSFVMESKYRARFLMMFSLPIALLISLLFLLHSNGDSTASAWSRNIWFWAHVGFLLTALAGLVTAVSSAWMYLWQSSLLKSHHPGAALLKLPSLGTLDKIHFRALVGGVVFFSLGILSGLFWASDLRELGAIWRDPKVILSFLTCLLYWGIVALRLSALGRGQKIAMGTLIVFVLLFGTYLSSYYVPSTFHKGL